MNYIEVCRASDRGTWLRERRTGIGGSDAAAVLGLNPWRSPLAVYAEKIGAADDAEENEAMLWGTKLEPLVLDHFGSVTGRIVRPAQTLLRSKTHPWILATLDGIQESEDRGEGQVEIKCTGLAEKWEEGPPPYVLAQVQHQLHVTSYPYASVAALFNGKSFAWWDIERDEEFIAHMLDVEAEFWGRVELREPPDPGPTWGDRQTLARLYPKDSGAIVQLDDSFTVVDQRLEELKAEKKKIEAQIMAGENALKGIIGDASMAVLPSGISYSYLTQERKTYAVEAQSFRVLKRKKAK